MSEGYEPTIDLYSDRDAFLASAGVIMRRCFASLPPDAIQSGKAEVLRGALRPGKMLRSRLAWALCSKQVAEQPAIIAAAAATELLHNATLFHDDIIDDAAMRRSKPTLWQEIGPTGAILMGDLFFCTSLDILANSGSTRNLLDFISRINEVCAAEVNHELACRGRILATTEALAIARGKTGALFAFVAESCGGDDISRREAYREAGYAIGTAYQLTDDLLDETGAENALGKTLGTDRSRRKFTLAQTGGLDHDELKRTIRRLCDGAIYRISAWPDQAARLRAYIDTDLLPIDKS